MKRIPMVLDLQHGERSTPSRRPCRSVRIADEAELAILLYSAFRGTPDDQGETFVEAEREIEATFAGTYGRLLLDCSFLIERDGLLASACLISWYEPAGTPFVVFTMTRPEFKRQGMARFLLSQSIEALVARGHSRLGLIVADGNVPAQALYASLGFRAEPSP